MTAARIFLFFVSSIIISVTQCEVSNKEEDNELSLPKIMFEAIVNPKDGLFLPKTALIGLRLCSFTIDTLKEKIRDQYALDTATECYKTFVPPIIKTFPNNSEFSVSCDEDTTMHLFKKCGPLLAVGLGFCFKHHNLSQSIPNDNWIFTEAYTTYFCKNYQKFYNDLVNERNNQLICITSENKNKIETCIDQQTEYVRETEEHLSNDFCRNYGIVKHCIYEHIKGKCIYDTTVNDFLTALSSAGKMRCQNKKFTYKAIVQKSTISAQWKPVPFFTLVLNLVLMVVIIS